MRVQFVIRGEPASKANSRRIVMTPRGMPRVVKSSKALSYEFTAVLQIPAAAKVMHEGPVRVTLHIFYRTERPDLDESLVLDAMQATFSDGGRDRGRVTRRGVYLNDRQVREKHIFHAIDSDNPRVEVLVESLP